eukprot:scaffold19696_cov128-Isochrysis_galbana.AAC.5
MWVTPHWENDTHAEQRPAVGPTSHRDALPQRIVGCCCVEKAARRGGITDGLKVVRGCAPKQRVQDRAQQFNREVEQRHNSHLSIDRHDRNPVCSGQEGPSRAIFARRYYM